MARSHDRRVSCAHFRHAGTRCDAGQGGCDRPEIRGPYDASETRMGLVGLRSLIGERRIHAVFWHCPQRIAAR